MTDTCKYCGSQTVQWGEENARWVLRNTNGGSVHRCSEYEAAKPRSPSVAKRKSAAAKGAFLRWYGPRSGRVEALLVEPSPGMDTPAGFYLEPTKSTFAECQRVRGFL